MRSLNYHSHNRRMVMYSFLAMEKILDHLQEDYMRQNDQNYGEGKQNELSGRIKRLQRKMNSLILEMR